MFRKVLVANRGEIAVRVIRTLHEMGIAAVAVYSDVDKHALHVRVADEAYAIGPAPARESYLRVDKILDVARRSGAEAVHPGYGFLSENAEFSDACAKAGIAFVGPPASAITAMGSKTGARARMIEAGVPVVPGGSASTLDEAKATARAIGYPVMLKATMGGGGKGMRLVHEEAELGPALERASSEALRSFGDGTVYLEKAITRARHVEIQVLGDREGNLVHLYERDCSVQRRHQKVVEETPCPAISRETVRAMGEVAVKGAKAVGYFSAGTFEFLVGEDESFYFLEMNTRLQVEHPITEWCVGRDLVRDMVRIAAGEPLGLAQADVHHQGASIECRVYAEDPSQNFCRARGASSRCAFRGGPSCATTEASTRAGWCPPSTIPSSRSSACGPPRASRPSRACAARWVSTWWPASAPTSPSTRSYSRTPTSWRDATTRASSASTPRPCWATRAPRPSRRGASPLRSRSPRAASSGARPPQARAQRATVGSLRGWRRIAPSSSGGEPLG
jgi:acetyl-CoA carboxylase biotin carboxylase subunit